MGLDIPRSVNRGLEVIQVCGAPRAGKAANATQLVKTKDRTVTVLLCNSWISLVPPALMPASL